MQPTSPARQSREPDSQPGSVGDPGSQPGSVGEPGSQPGSGGTTRSSSGELRVVLQPQSLGAAGGGGAAVVTGPALPTNLIPEGLSVAASRSLHSRESRISGYARE